MSVQSQSSPEHVQGKVHWEPSPPQAFFRVRAGYHDRTGEHRPKIIFAGREVHHTKEHHIKVKNTIGCGCKGNHDPNDERCFYNVVKTYMADKDKSDLLFMSEDYVKLNQQTRRVHVDEEGDLRPVNFFRAMSRKGADRCTPNTRAPPPEHGRQHDA